jgi:hypothetical protein
MPLGARPEEHAHAQHHPFTLRRPDRRNLGGACPDDPTGNPCPPSGTVIEPGGPEDIKYNDCVVGVRWWDEVSTGWQRFTSSALEGECTTDSTNDQSECFEAGTVITVDAQFTSYADGNCGTYWGWPIWQQYKASGLFLGACGTWAFSSDGAGGDFTIRSCPVAGVVLSEVSRTPYTVQVPGGYEWTLGYQVVILETDGECGERENTRYEWLPYGTILGTDGTSYSYSDGNGWYYTDGNCGSYDLTMTEYLPLGALLSTDGVSNYDSDGAGGYYTGNC